MAFGKIYFACCLLGGCFCDQWAVFLPQTLVGLSGSCVVVPCSFSVPSDWEKHLDGSCKAVWKRGSWSRTQVFDSSLSGAAAALNVMQGNLTGDLRDKNCTTVFYDLPSNHGDSYYFRLQCDNLLKFNFQKSVRITIQDFLPKPTLSASGTEVEEGSPVVLNCSAVSPCSLRPPALTWTPQIGDVRENMEATAVISVLSFNASHLHDGLKFSCNVFYNRGTKAGEVEYEKSLTLRVFYPPTNTSITYDGPVKDGSVATLTCAADANPAVDGYTWFKTDGERVTAVGSQKQLSTLVTEIDNRLSCEVSNKYGNASSPVTSIDVQFSPKETSVVIDPVGPVLEGSTVSLLCRSRSNPPVTNYTWYKDDEVHQETGQVFGIDVGISDGGDYRCAARNVLGEESSAGILLDVQYPPKNTSVSAEPPGPIPAGSSVTLTCSSAANPAVLNFTWFHSSVRGNQAVGFERLFTFNATKLSEDRFFCEARNVHGADYSESTSPQVTFAAEILPSSRCVRILSQFRCSCDSRGNPIPSLLWEFAGELVNQSADGSIQQITLGSWTVRSIITFPHQEEEFLSLTCLSRNTLGTESRTFNVSASQTQIALHCLSLALGSALGALGMLLVCVPLLMFFCRRRKRNFSFDRKPAETSQTGMAEQIFYNAMLGSCLRVEGTVESEIDRRIGAASALQVKPEDGTGNGIKEPTTKSAEINLDQAKETMEEGNPKSSHSEQKGNIDTLTGQVPKKLGI